ncbi:hypothetical protein KDN24_07280 [Bacillus sp. Bva_UNVM-123]|uniref:hypothetical protein n=1 Tax=Bacillus sp. Bva_UNVM-123 TaxID=2829798 RepID=UPI00391F58BD
MTAQRLILLLVMVIVLIASVAEIIFNGFSLKTILLLAATVILVIFLWFRPENRQ